jgi:regulatory protein
VKKQELRDDPEGAYSYAIWLLARREYAFEELVRKIGSRYVKEAALAAAQKARAEGSQSDQRMAEMLARHAAFAHQGPQKARLEARRRGLDPDLLTPYLEEQDFGAQALDFLERRYGSLESVDYKTGQKMLAALCRRGFDRDTCLEAFERFSSSRS